MITQFMRDRCEITIRDEGMVIRLRGPYNTPDVDYWPRTGTVRQVGANKEVFRLKDGHFAARLALHGVVQ